MSVDGRVGQDEPGRAEVDRARRRFWVVFAVAMVAATAVAILLSLVLPSSTSSGPVPPWREQVSGVLNVAGIVLVVVGSVHAARKGLLSSRYAAQARRFSPAQRRHARRCVRRGQPTPQGLGGAAVLVAQALVRQCHILILLAGIAANVLSNVLTSTDSLWTTIEVVVLVVMLASSILTLVTARGAQRWLQTYAPATPGQSVG